MKKRLIATAILMASSIGWAENAANKAPAYPANVRFTLIQLGPNAWESYLVDSQTGKMWHLAVMDKELGNSLVPVPFLCLEKGNKKLGYDPNCLKE